MSNAPPTSSNKNIFSVPPFIRKLFDAFPLVSYPPYPLPARSCCSRPSRRPQLFVWITPKEASKPPGVGGYSFDPECLKWQTYFRFCGIPYINTPSNNHACPTNTGVSLPFLIPHSVASAAAAAAEGSSPHRPIQLPPPVPATKLAQWARDNRPRKWDKPHDRGEEEEEEEQEEEEQEVYFERGDVQAFMELLDNEIRNALLYTTHVYRPNLYRTTAPLYAQSSSRLISSPAARGLLDSALSQLKHRYPGVVDPTSIFAEATTALDALSVKLGDDTWFFNSKVPGLLDAAVFAYLHVILTGEWEEKWASGLKGLVENRQNLVRFWSRVNKDWWEPSWVQPD